MARRPRFDLAGVAQLACSRYIELNPVRAWIAAHPDHYPWSSHGGNAGRRRDPLLAPHPAYLALAAEAPARAAAYRALFAEALSEEMVAKIRGHLQQQKVLGSDAFQRWVAQRTGQFTGLRHRGRPTDRGKCP